MFEYKKNLLATHQAPNLRQFFFKEKFNTNVIGTSSKSIGLFPCKDCNLLC